MTLMAMLSVVFAVLAAVSNALGTVLQRRAALIVPQSDGFRLQLMWDLLRTPVWAFGILGVIMAAIFQGLALVTGPLAVVQPIFVLELPAALLISGLVFRKRMPLRGWLSVGCIVLGLGTGLVLAGAVGLSRLDVLNKPEAAEQGPPDTAADTSSDASSEGASHPTA